ncbi:MAG: SDR family NAD(P)-dependent oxidoreductase [Pseudomonadota bacterium]
MAAQKLVWITGASQGIGRALSLELALRGHIVAASARNLDALQELSYDAASYPGSVHAFSLNVTEQVEVIEAFNEIENTLGQIDVAVLNAGTHIETPANDFHSADVSHLMQLNFMGCVFALEQLLPLMRARKSGRIAVVSSLAGYRGLPTASGYGASKAALINLCESLRLELSGSGVTMQVVNPGFVKTPLTDRNPFEMPFLISAKSAAVRIANGLESNRFEIRFPRRFAWIMAFLRHCPFWLYSLLVKNKTTRER